MNIKEHELNLIRAGNHPTRKLCSLCEGLGFYYKRDLAYMCLYCGGRGSVFIESVDDNLSWKDTLGKLF